MHSMAKGETMDHSYYIENCLKFVIKEIKKQRPLTGVHGIKLLHDNSRVHDAEEVENFLKQEGINLISIHLIHQIYLLMIIGSTMKLSGI